jgi:phospholipid/cholesterol/gamma-HCH transport system substrate-binding protein
VAILKNTRDATAQARDILRTIGDAVGSSQQGDLKEGVKSLKSNLAKLDASLTNVQEITDKINKGQGTVGHLINDDKLAKNLDKASTSLTSLLGSADTLKIEVNERSEFLIGVLNAKAAPGSATGVPSAAYSPWTKNYFGFRIIPKPDKWYGFEIVDDPRGVTRRVHVINNPANPPNFPAEYDQTTTERQLKFSAYLAKRYGPISGRFGILENTGGFGIKGHFLNDALTVSLDAFEFANPLKDHPRVKLYADYRFLDHLLVTAGADDFANGPQYDPVLHSRIISGRDYFLGAGVFFTDEDISKLIGLATSRF